MRPWPNELFSVVNDRVRKLFPLCRGSVYGHDSAFSIGRHGYTPGAHDSAALFDGHVECLVIYLRVGTHVRIGIAGYFVIFAVELPFPLAADGLFVCVDAFSRYFPPASTQPLRVINNLNYSWQCRVSALTSIRLASTCPP